MKIRNSLFFRLFIFLLFFSLIELFICYILKLKESESFIFFNLFISSLFFSFFTSFILFFKTRKKIDTITSGLSKLKELNFDTKIIIENSESYEFKELFENFNKTTTTLNTFFNELKIKSKTEFFFSYLKEAAIIIDSKGKIIKVNNSFIELFNLPLTPIDKYFWEIVRNNKILDDINEITVTNLSLNKTGEIEINGKIIIYHITKLVEANLILVIFHDVTEIKKINTIKKDFISNLTHELMSPLTAINGYLEILIDSVNNPTDKEVIEIIKKNTDRMIKIVKDLLYLSSLENELTYKNIIYEEIYLRKLVENIMPIFKDKIEKKQLSLFIDIPETIKLECDSFKIEQLLINLVDNAIKYSDKGKIVITAKELNQNIIFEISDEGIGIPEEYLDRIFERFFVVDKSRSKENSGTGLGLSIVKHIVLLHKGEIKVESKIGYGTKFIIKLPIKHTVKT